MLLIVVILSLTTAVYCNQYVVTDEAWFEVSIKDLDGPGQDYKGRFVIALFGEVAPVTTLNFVSLAKGHKKGKTTLHYKDTPIHRVVPDFIIQMGDVASKDGTASVSIYGEQFGDEEFIMSHQAAGMVAMANHGTDTNGSQFYILLQKARWLDGKHVVFGKVTEGMDVVKIIGEVPVKAGTSDPVKKIMITDSGLNTLDSKYSLTDDQLNADEV